LPRLLSIFLIVMIMALPQAASAAYNEKELRIGLLPELNVFTQMNRFKPLADYLTKKVGVDIKLTMLSRYGNIIESLKKQEVDAAFLGSFTGAFAITQLGVEPLARPVNLDGTSTYTGLLFVRKDSGITKVADMKGKTLVLVEKATTAGYVFPIAYFIKFGIADSSTYFKRKYFAGSHDAAIDAVLNHRADVGAAKNTVYERMRGKSPRIDKELEILATSDPVPSNGLCVLPQMNAGLKKRLKETLLAMQGDPEAQEVLKRFEALRFVDTGIKDYKPVYDMVQEAGIVLKDYKYTNP